jgi:hypothetical protein
MKGTVIVEEINVRRADDTPFGTSLKLGDVVYGLPYNDGRNKISFDKIYRADGTIQNLGEVCNAAVDNDGSPLVRWIVLTDEEEPGDPEPPPPAVTHALSIDFDSNGEVINVFVDGVKYVKAA